MYRTQAILSAIKLFSFISQYEYNDRCSFIEQLILDLIAEKDPISAEDLQNLYTVSVNRRLPCSVPLALINKGLPVDQYLTDDAYARTPLALAITHYPIRQVAPIVKLLLEKGANPSDTTFMISDRTVLTHALENGDFEVSKLLLEDECQITVEDYNAFLEPRHPDLEFTLEQKIELHNLFIARGVGQPLSSNQDDQI
jgi:hypothetical protein